LKSRDDVIVLQHAEPEGPGLLGAAIKARKLPMRTIKTFAGDEVPDDVGGARGLVILGGSMGVADTDEHPFLKRELRLIERALRAEVPILGVCLGSQLLASVLGARVRTAASKEIGWFPLILGPDAAHDALFKGVEPFVPLHWHGDVFALPAGASPLARSEKTPVQAFRHDAKTYGILFHMELTMPMVKDWARAFAAELDAERISAARIVAAAEAHITKTNAAARAVFKRWASLCE
jgi:GMP synthase-like glutamine amidotransferase